MTYEIEKVLMRDVYAQTLTALAEGDERIIALDADLMGSSGMRPFAKAHPDRFINCGIAEANMVGVASGLSALGKIPFAHSFAAFASKRACDQIFMSAAYSGMNVRIIGTDPGVCAAFNGGTHMPFEDMAVLRGIGGITLLEPTDSSMLKKLVPMLVEAYGVFYIRLMRKNAVKIYDESDSFEIGKGKVLREGGDVTLFCSGIMVAEALKAADLLTEKSIEAKVVNLFTWKPIDTELIARCAAETGAAVTCENHNIYGGFGSAVAEALVKTRPVPVEMVGIQDEFGEVGPEDYLRGRFHLNAVDIAAAALRAVNRK